MGVTTNGAGEALKSPAAGLRAAAVVKLNAAFLALFLLAYMALLLHPKYSYLLDHGAASLVRCTFRDACPTQLSRKLGGAPANKVAAERIVNAGRAPTMFDELRGRQRMGLVNIDRDELLALGVEGDAVAVDFERVSDVFQWTDLFPEWIDEEEDDEGPSCPEFFAKRHLPFFIATWIMLQDTKTLGNVKKQNCLFTTSSVGIRLVFLPPRCHPNITCNTWEKNTNLAKENYNQGYELNQRILHLRLFSLLADVRHILCEQ